MNFELSKNIHGMPQVALKRCEIPIFVHFVHKVCFEVRISSEIGI